MRFLVAGKMLKEKRRQVVASDGNEPQNTNEAQHRDKWQFHRFNGRNLSEIRQKGKPDRPSTIIAPLMGIGLSGCD